MTLKNLIINKYLEIDIKKTSKKLNKYLKIYAFKSAYLNTEIKTFKHNDYLNIVSRICGYSSFNEFNQKESNKIIKVETEKFLSNLKKILYDLNKESIYNKKDIEQIVETFYIYFVYEDKKISINKSNIKEKIKRRINKVKKISDDIYEVEEYERLLKIISNKYFSTVIIDCDSILNYDYKNKDDKKYEIEVRELLFQYYLFRNANTIKQYQKNKIFSDIIGENVYLFEDFLKERKYDEYIPFEKLKFLADQFTYYHNGMNDSEYRRVVNDFKAFINEKFFGKNVLINGIFKTVNEDNKVLYKSNISKNIIGQWSYIDIKLANNDNFKLNIYDDGEIWAAKEFFGENILIRLYTYEDKVPLRFTIPKVERNGSLKEGFPFFYPKYNADKFILKLLLETNGYDTIILNRFGILKKDKEEIDITFSFIMRELYKEAISEISKNKSKYKDYKNKINELSEKIDTDYLD